MWARHRVRPAAISFHQRDVYLGRKVAFPHESFARLGVHFRLLRHVSSHFVGSGRYAVTTTAGELWPAGIPQTT